MTRKIIQITTCASDSNDGGFFNETLALCDDGSVWTLLGEEYARVADSCHVANEAKPERWERLLDIPQD